MNGINGQSEKLNKKKPSVNSGIKKASAKKKLAQNSAKAKSVFGQIKQNSSVISRNQTKTPIYQQNSADKSKIVGSIDEISKTLQEKNLSKNDADTIAQILNINSSDNVIDKKENDAVLKAINTMRKESGEEEVGSITLDDLARLGLSEDKDGNGLSDGIDSIYREYYEDDIKTVDGLDIEEAKSLNDDQKIALSDFITPDSTIEYDNKGNIICTDEYGKSVTVNQYGDILSYRGLTEEDFIDENGNRIEGFEDLTFDSGKTYSLVLNNETGEYEAKTEQAETLTIPAKYDMVSTGNSLDSCTDSQLEALKGMEIDVKTVVDTYGNGDIVVITPDGNAKKIDTDGNVTKIDTEITTYDNGKVRKIFYEYADEFENLYTRNIWYNADGSIDGSSFDISDKDYKPIKSIGYYPNGKPNVVQDTIFYEF